MRAWVMGVAAALALGGCASLLRPAPTTVPAEVRAGEYQLDTDHAALTFGIDHLGFSTFMGRFERFDASLDFDPARPESARVEAVIDMTSLDIANDAFAAELMGPNWFDTARFPKAFLQSTGIEVTGANTARMSAELTLKGVTAPVVLDVTFNGGARDALRGAYVTGFSVRGTIDRTAFGVDRYAGLLAGSVDIRVEAEFIRR